MTRNVFLATYIVMIVASGLLNRAGLTPPGYDETEAFVVLSLFFLAIVVSAIAHEVVGDE